MRLCSPTRISLPDDPARYRSTPIPVPVKVRGVRQFDLILRRYPPPGDERLGTVLLIHGASANSDSFLVPHGGLVRYLTGRGWDVWTLDWRGSWNVVQSLPDRYVGGSLEDECAHFSLDAVAEFDFRAALEKMRECLKDDPYFKDHPKISLVAHCFGSGALSVAISRGHVEDLGVENVVLSTLGLFYEVPWNGWVKVEDFIIERILGDSPKVRAIDPRYFSTWPHHMKAAYEAWPSAWLPTATNWGERIFNRLCFMFGAPYVPDLIPRSIHEHLLPTLFGGMHLGLYLQAGQLVRRGYADRLNELDVIDRSRLRDERATVPRDVIGDLKPDFFIDKKVTLIGGAQNQLWHRDSVDLMYEWLLKNHPKKPPAKHVFRNHAHQDLLWGTDAAKQGGVFETIAKAI
jgi:pimeloyl-ACP methyl ester carboxylesterase